jgi:hypothetical protein
LNEHLIHLEGVQLAGTEALNGLRDLRDQQPPAAGLAREGQGRPGRSLGRCQDGAAQEGWMHLQRVCACAPQA